MCLILLEELIIQFLEVYKDRNLKEAITELTSKLATGEKLLGYDVDETSKK